MISSWARMCKILGKDFERYLSVVMGPVLKTASFKPEIAVVDGNISFHLLESNFRLSSFSNLYMFKEEEVKEISDEDDWQFVTIGDQVKFQSKLKIIKKKVLL